MYSLLKMVIIQPAMLVYQRVIHAWYPKHQFLNGCFNWMIPNLYIKNGCFTKHPLKNGLFRVPGWICCSTTSLQKGFRCTKIDFETPKSVETVRFFGSHPAKTFGCRLRTMGLLPTEDPWMFQVCFLLVYRSINHRIHKLWLQQKSQVFQCFCRGSCKNATSDSFPLILSQNYVCVAQN